MTTRLPITPEPNNYTSWDNVCIVAIEGASIILDTFDGEDLRPFSVNGQAVEAYPYNLKWQWSADGHAITMVDGFAIPLEQVLYGTTVSFMDGDPSNYQMVNIEFSEE